MTRTERWLILIVCMAGLVLRCAAWDRLAVEHFDEGVYASNLLFPDDGYRYPDLELYAPPLQPLLVENSLLLAGPDASDLVPFIPGLLFGSLTVPLAWWVTRRWAGSAAGVGAATLIALNDFHIVLSRSVLTDAPLVFWLILAVWLISEALAESDLRLAVAGGIVTGLAWSTKYNGWLPLAIATSGLIAALVMLPPVARQVMERPTTRSSSSKRKSAQRGSSMEHHPESWLSAGGGLRGRIICLLVIVLLAGLTWSPVYWGLQDDGGYSRVAANHRNYLTGLSGWFDAALRHEAVQRYYAGWPTLLSGWLAVLAAGLVLRAERFTWNRSPVASSPDTVSSSQSSTGSTPSSSTWNQSAATLESASAAAGFTWNESMAGRSYAITLVICAGLTGALILSPLIVLAVWSVTEFLSALWTMRRRLADGHDAVPVGGPQYDGKRFHVEPNPISNRETVRSSTTTRSQLVTSQRGSGKRDGQPDSSSVEDTGDVSGRRLWFATWLCLAWAVGLLLTTPLYRPYPRLILPLLAVAWMGSGMAIVRLIHGRIINTGRLPLRSSPAEGDADRGESLNAAAPAPTKPAQRSVADHQADASSEPQPVSKAGRRGLRFAWLVPITLLCVLLASVRSGRTWQDRRQFADLADRLVEDVLSTSKDDSRSTAVVRGVIYVYGEPGLLYHLPQPDIPVRPIVDLSFASPDSGHPDIPTFLVAGPHAQRNPQFNEQLAAVREFLEPVATYEYRPSSFVWLDDAGPPRRPYDSEIWLYRVKPRTGSQP